jgi:hypothetical protein
MRTGKQHVCPRNLDLEPGGDLVHRDTVRLAARNRQSRGAENLTRDGRRAVGVLLIRCPKTGRDFSTGIHVDADTLARVPQEFTHTRCPYCKTQHFWLPREAKLVEAFPQEE